MSLCRRAILPLLLPLGGCSLLFQPLESAPADASRGDAAPKGYSLTLQWQKPTGAIGGALAVDHDNAPVVAGHFTGSASVDTRTFVSVGGLDLFLGRFDGATGNLTNAISYGGTGAEFVTSVSIGGNNEAVIAGGLIGADTTVGGDTFDTSGANPTIGFVASYDGVFAHRWSIALDSNASNASVNGLSASAGPIFISGGYAGDLVVGQTGGSAASFAGQDGLAAYYAKYNPDGSFAGGQASFTGEGEERCEVVVADGLGSAYIAGFFSSEIAFDAPVGTLQAQAEPAGMDFFVGRIGHTANLHFVTTMPGNTFSYPVMKGALGKDNRLVLASEFAGTVNVADLQQLLRTTSAEADIALFIIDPTSGQVVSAQSFPSLGTDRSSAVAVGPDGEIGLVGRFSGKINFGADELSSEGGDDVFIAVFDAEGRHLWSRGYGSTLDDSAIGAAFDEDGALYVTVRHQDGIDFGMGPLSGVNQGVLLKFAAR